MRQRRADPYQHRQEPVHRLSVPDGPPHGSRETHRACTRLAHRGGRLLRADTFRVLQRWPCDELPLLRLRWPRPHLWRAPMRGCSGPRQPACWLLGRVEPWRPATKSEVTSTRYVALGWGSWHANGRGHFGCRRWAAGYLYLSAASVHCVGRAQGDKMLLACTAARNLAHAAVELSFGLALLRLQGGLVGASSGYREFVA